MRNSGCRRLWHLRLAALAWPLVSTSVHGCATCFGRSDSDLARGMNMGILSLLVVVGLVLSGILGFFVFVLRRSARLAEDDPRPGALPDEPEGSAS